MTKCDHETEHWGPHPGCKEFMAEPEVSACDRTATKALQVTTMEPPDEEIHEPHEVTEWYFRCADHTEPILGAPYAFPITNIRVFALGSGDNCDCSTTGCIHDRRF